MSTSKTTRKKTTKKASKKGTYNRKVTTKKAASKKANGKISMAQFMNELAASKKSAEAMTKALQAEAKRRGLDEAAYTYARLRGHVKHRQSLGQLKGVKLPEFKQS